MKFAAIKLNKSIFYLISVLFIESALMGSSLRQLNQIGKKVAPNQHDHAAYFSSGKKEISPEALSKADQLRKETIKSIKQLLKSNISDFQKFELYLRLGEIYAERHDYLRDVEIKEYEKKYKSWDRLGKKGREPKLSYRESNRELLNSASSFRKLVRLYPKHPRADAALYSLAKTLGRLNNDSAALYFKQLIRSHPNSPLIADAHLALGEYYFDNDKVLKAIKSYQSAIKYKDSKVYPYAVYKLGWAFYNSPANNQRDTNKNIKKALSAFKLVVKLSEQNPGSNTGLNLRAEAIKDLVLVWAETEGVNEAFSYFSKKGMNKEFYDVLEHLGYIYTDQGKNKKAIEVYTRLLKEAPLRENNYNIHVKISDLHEKNHRPELVIADLKAMNRLYVKNSRWIEANQKNPGIIKEAYEKTELYTRRYSAIFHQLSQKQKNKRYLTSAKKGYALYLISFPSNPNAYELRYYYADVLYEFKDFQNASLEFIKVAKQKPKDGKYLKDSAYNAVICINNIDKVTKYPKLPPAGQIENPMPLPKIKKILIEAIDLYVSLLPKEKEGFPMRFTASETLFRYGHYRKALTRFDKIIYEIPREKQATSSLRVTLSYYNEKNDWNNLVSKSRKYLEYKPILSKENSKFIMSHIKEGVYRLATQYEKSGKYEKAAENFLAFQREFPKDKSSDRALYNAMLNYFKLAKTERALATGSVLIKEYPKSKLVPGVLASIAQTNESLADFGKAADSYREFNYRFPRDPRASGALFNAAILYKGLKKYDQSVKLFERFISYYPKNSLKKECYFEIASIEEKRKNYSNSYKNYQNFGKSAKKTDKERSLLALAKAADIEYVHISKKNGLRKLRDLRRTLKRKNSPQAYEARRIVANRFFQMLDPNLTRFKNTPINNPEKLQNQVVAKQVQLVKLAKDYQDVIAIGSGEFVVASLYRLGQLHEDFSNALFKVPSPKGVDQVGIDQFRTSIEKVAFPLKEESFKFYETSFQRSKEVMTFTKWTRLTYNKMVELSPKKYPEIKEKHHVPTYLSHKLEWNDTLLVLTE